MTGIWWAPAHPRLFGRSCTLRRSFSTMAQKVCVEMQGMTDDDYRQKLNELDRLLNDPDVAMQPTLIWRLFGEVSDQDMQADTTPSPQR